MTAPFARGLRLPCAGITELMYCFPIEAKYPKDSWGPNLDLARAVCRYCPVRVECLEYALATRQEDGVWGGTTPWERRSIRRRRQRAARQLTLASVG
jgi:WhiB family redox-sensing transcriptional regulator